MSRRRVLVVVAILVPIVAMFLTDRWFFDPAQDVPERSDAVIMLAGGRGERLEAATDLIDDGLADTLVIMNGTNWSKGFQLCNAGDEVGYEVLCPTEPGNTRGEAREIRDLAAARGWDSVILVTSDYHLHRATTNVSRCFDGAIHRVAAESNFGLMRAARALAIEWAGTLRNVVVRGC